MRRCKQYFVCAYQVKLYASTKSEETHLFVCFYDLTIFAVCRGGEGERERAKMDFYNILYNE